MVPPGYVHLCSCKIHLKIIFAHNLIVFGIILSRMSTEWEGTKADWSITTPPPPLSTIEESDDSPPSIHTVDELDSEPSSTLPNYYDTNNWGDYREDEQEPNKAIDEIYYSDDDEESPIDPAIERDHQLLQGPTVDNDICNQDDNPTVTIIRLKEEIAKLAVASRDQIRMRQHKCCQLARLESKLQFEQMPSTHQKALIKRLQFRCENSASDRAHARVFHENIVAFNKYNETILKHAGYLSPDGFYE